MLHGELSGVASEHTKTFSFLFFCNLVWCQGILIGSSTSTEALDCDSKKEKKSTLLIREQNSFMTGTAQLNGSLTLRP